jgi:hypothetical protein
MTDEVDYTYREIEYIQPEAIEPHDWVMELRRVLGNTLEPQREALREAGDAETLSRGWHDLQPLVSELYAFLRSIQVDVAAIMDDRHDRKMEVPGVGVVEREFGHERKNWESKQLLMRVIGAALVDPETGEILDLPPMEVAERIAGTLTSCLTMSGSTPWKVGRSTPDGYDGGLRSLGIDPSEWCDETERPPLARIPRKRLDSDEHRKQ